jgi:energy-coupling factor transport system permease protein
LTLLFASSLAVALWRGLPLKDLRLVAVGWAILGVLSAGFNFLTVHAGDVVLLQLPQDIPVFGGIYTVNALVYGLQLAAVFSCLSLAFWVFWRGSRMIDIYRMVPRRLHSLGVAVTLGLTLFPGLVQAVGHVLDAQKLRLVGMGRLKRLSVLVIPVVGIALDRSLQLAEAMESRGFGSTRRDATWVPLGMAVGSTLCLVAIYVSLSWGRPAGYIMLGGGLAVLAVSLFEMSDAGRAFGSLRNSGPGDAIVLASSVVTAGGFLVAALWGAPSLNYYPYPKLTLPGFEAWLGIVAVTPSVPAVVGLAVRDRAR